MIALIVGSLSVCAASACITYDVRQSSLVPVAAPPPPPPPQLTRSGVDAYVGDRTVTFLGRPELAPNERAGLWIPRTQLNGALSYAWPRVAFRTVWLVGLAEGATAAAPTTLPNPGDAVIGFGPGVVVHATSPESRLTLSFGVDTLVLSVPSYVIATCTSYCDEDGLADGAVVERHQRDAVSLYALSVTAGWRIDDTTTLGGVVSMQNHPTNVERFTSDAADAEVQDGPLNVIVGANVEVRIVPWLSAIAELSWPVTAEPVRYGPIVGVGLRAGTGTRASAEP